MKQSFLLICFLTIATSSFSQAKFYSNGKEVRELTCNMPDIKVTAVVPPEVANHDLIELTVGYIPDNNGFESLSYDNRIVYQVDFLKGQKEVTAWIKSPKMKTGDFCKKTGTCFEIDGECDATYRNYTSGTISVRFFGKDIKGYEWVNNQKLPVYKYGPALSKNNIKITYGEIIMKVSSRDNSFVGTKFVGPNFISFVTPNKDYNLLESTYASTKGKDYKDNPVFENPILFHATVLDNKKDPSVKLSKEYIKHIIMLDLLKNANQYENNDMSKNNLENTKIRYSTYVIPIVTEMQLDNKSKPTDRKSEISDLEKHLKSQESDLKWESVKLGNCAAEMIKFTSYNRNDMKRKPSGYWGIKPEAVPNFYYYFVGEIDGKVVAGSFSREKAQDLTADEQKYIEHMLKTFEIK